MPKSILIVDDSPQIRKLVRTYFDRQTDFQICGEAVDGLDAIEKATELHPDLIILDESMPRMDGLKAARILHSMPRQVPIILFTLHAETITSEDASDAGIASIVSKTDGITELGEQVDSLLRYASGKGRAVRNGAS
jgi:two-component system vancomycin resistance associated response regulator VraR